LRIICSHPPSAKFIQLNPCETSKTLEKGDASGIALFVLKRHRLKMCFDWARMTLCSFYSSDGVQRHAGFNSCQLAKFASTQPPEKSGLKRDGPVFFSSAPVKVAGDEKTIIVIGAPLSRRSLGEGGSAKMGRTACRHPHTCIAISHQPSPIVNSELKTCSVEKIKE
jgi:hypothetical protein